MCVCVSQTELRMGGGPGFLLFAPLDVTGWGGWTEWRECPWGMTDLCDHRRLVAHALMGVFTGMARNTQISPQKGMHQSAFQF